jgi:hypothetical protein
MTIVGAILMLQWGGSRCPASCRDENIQDVAILIHGPPQIVPFAVDTEKDFIGKLQSGMVRRTGCVRSSCVYFVAIICSGARLCSTHCSRAPSASKTFGPGPGCSGTCPGP